MSYPSNNQENEFNNITQDKLDSMSAAELLELLESINDTMTEDNFSDDLISACLDALDRKSPMPGYLPTEESWHSFENKVGIDSNTGNINNTSVSVTGHKVKRVFRTGLAAAIIVFCLFSCMIVAQAAGVDVFGSIARWTDSVFGFGEVVGSLETDNPSELTKEVTGLDYIESWLPALDEQFVKSEPMIIEDEHIRTLYYSLTFASEDGTLVFDAFSRGEDSQNSLYEKDGSNVNAIILDKATFYIFENNGENIAAWTANGVEFSLLSSFSREELEHILIESYGGR